MLLLHRVKACISNGWDKRIDPKIRYTSQKTHCVMETCTCPESSRLIDCKLHPTSMLKLIHGQKTHILNKSKGYYHLFLLTTLLFLIWKTVEAKRNITRWCQPFREAISILWRVIFLEDSFVMLCHKDNTVYVSRVCQVFAHHTAITIIII